GCRRWAHAWSPACGVGRTVGRRGEAAARLAWPATSRWRYRIRRSAGGGTRKPRSSVGARTDAPRDNCRSGGNDLLVRGVAVMVAMGGQLLGVTLSVQDTAYDFEPSLAGEIAEHGVELEVHLGQRFLHALNAGRGFLDQGLALAHKGAQRHDGSRGTEAGTQEPHAVELP